MNKGYDHIIKRHTCDKHTVVEGFEEYVPQRGRVYPGGGVQRDGRVGGGGEEHVAIGTSRERGVFGRRIRHYNADDEFRHWNSSISHERSRAHRERRRRYQRVQHHLLHERIPCRIKDGDRHDSVSRLGE